MSLLESHMLVNSISGGFFWSRCPKGQRILLDHFAPFKTLRLTTEYLEMLIYMNYLCLSRNFGNVRY